ncbi:hypothetical protein DIPPA_20266 [Diplonema papillatum]|nr:hypothetical protein DIPPA_20266 [Diplonema papillatum]
MSQPQAAVRWRDDFGELSDVEYAALTDPQRVRATAEAVSKGWVDTLARRVTGDSDDWEQALASTYSKARSLLLSGHLQQTPGQAYPTDAYSDARKTYAAHGHCAPPGQSICGGAPLDFDSIGAFYAETPADDEPPAEAPPPPQQRPASGYILGLARKNAGGGSAAKRSGGGAQGPRALPVPAGKKRAVAGGVPRGAAGRDVQVVLTPVAFGGEGLASKPVLPTSAVFSPASRAMQSPAMLADVIDVDTDVRMRKIAPAASPKGPLAAGKAIRDKDHPPSSPSQAAAKTVVEPTVLCPVRVQTGCGLSWPRAADLTAQLTAHLTSVHGIDPATIQRYLSRATTERLQCFQCEFNELTDTPVATFIAHLRVIHKYTAAQARAAAEKHWKNLGRLPKK